MQTVDVLFIHLKHGAWNRGILTHELLLLFSKRNLDVHMQLHSAIAENCELVVYSGHCGQGGSCSLCGHKNRVLK